MSTPFYTPMMGWGTGSNDGPPILHPWSGAPVVMLHPCPFSQWRRETIVSDKCTVSGGDGYVQVNGASDATPGSATVKVSMLYDGNSQIRLARSSSLDQNYAVGYFNPAIPGGFSLYASTPIITRAVPYYRYAVTLALVVFSTTFIRVSMTLI